MGGVPGGVPTLYSVELSRENIVGDGKNLRGGDDEIITNWDSGTLLWDTTFPE